MSGPKVVRIVTREEIIAICKDMLAQLALEIQRWERIGERNDVLTDQETAATRKRQADLGALLAADRFPDLQKQVPDEIAYLRANMAERLEAAASKAATARLHGRRLANMAQQSLDRDARGDIKIPLELRRSLESVVASHGSDRVQAEKALSDTMILTLRHQQSPVLSPEQEAHAKRLRGTEKAVSFEQWLAKNTPELDNSVIKVEAMIEGLRLAGAVALAGRFEDRQKVIQQEGSPARRQMLADTLTLELGKALADVRQKEELLRTLEQQAAPLMGLRRAEAAALSQRIAVAVAEKDVASAAALIEQAKRVLDSERKAFAAKAQRTALLLALKDLGYEVREGMETVAPKDGKVILRRAANPDMGVEIAGLQDAERLQFRPVRFGQADTAEDRGKDRDIETMWCSDFDRLSNEIIAGQGSLNIERALPVGAVPVLFVSEAPSSDDRRPDVRTPTRTRTLR